MVEPNIVAIDQKKQDWSVIGLVGVAHAGSHFSHLLMPLMFPFFTEVFHLSFTQLGLTVTFFFVVSGVGQALSGFVVDRFTPIVVLLASLVMLSVGCLVASQADGLNDLLFASLLLGLGNCSFHPVDFSILNGRVSVDRIGYAYSAHGLCGNLGWALAPIFMLTIAEVADWRVAYVYASLFYALILIFIWTNRKSLSITTNSNQLSFGAGSFSFLRNSNVWWCFAFFISSTITLSVIQSFSVVILQKLHDVSLWAANASLSGYMLFAALGMLVGGVVSTKLPAKCNLVIASCMSVGAVLLGLSSLGWLGAVGSMFFLSFTGFALGVGGPSRDLLIRSATPEGATGRVYGLVYSGLDVGFAVAPVAFGMLMDQGSYALTLQLAALSLLVSIFFVLLVAQKARV